MLEGHGPVLDLAVFGFQKVVIFNVMEKTVSFRQLHHRGGFGLGRRGALAHLLARRHYIQGVLPADAHKKPERPDVRYLFFRCG